jgi:hypothetical protein
MQQQLQIIKNFTPASAKIRYDTKEDGIVVYYAVLIINGKIDIEKYPSGRIKPYKLNDNETVLCFKKILSKDFKDVKKLYLREYIGTSNLSNEDLLLYEYIKENTQK